MKLEAPKLKKDNYCKVCGKCVLSCPSDAIKIELCEFNYAPVVDYSRCTNCKKCEKACNLSDEIKKEDFKESSYYVAITKDRKIWKLSSSGGMFTEISRYILNQNGIVAGASFIQGKNLVEHIILENEIDLQKCRKSKYVQSNPTKVYKSIEKAVDDNRWILFSGTPCQVEPIYEKYKNYDKLICLDLYCHGVSNANIFKEYLFSMQKSVKNIDFRADGKETNYNLQIEFDDDNFISEDCNVNVFYKEFISSSNLKLSCFDCVHAKYKHRSDLTIGDWDFDDFSKERGIKEKKTSIVAINTKKGENLFNEIKKNINLIPISDMNLIKTYYPNHKLMKGLWGYNKELAEIFKKIYKEYDLDLAFFACSNYDVYNLLSKIKNTYSGENVWLYGSGKRGKIFLDMIEKFFPKFNIKGFLDSEKKEEKAYGYDVKCIFDLTEEEIKNDIFIISVYDKLQKILQENLQNLGVKKIFKI